MTSRASDVVKMDGGMANDHQLSRHGAKSLPAAMVENYNLDIKRQGEILNLRVRKGAFYEKIDNIRQDLDLPLRFSSTEI